MKLTCWNCKKSVTLKERENNDGDCPHCEAELDLGTYVEGWLSKMEGLQEAEAYLDSFITYVEQSVYGCPECADKIDLEKIVDLKEAKIALEKLQAYNAIPK